jgi:hypothetical protein
MVWDMNRRACGFLTAEEALAPQVLSVTNVTRYGVDFTLRLQNVSWRPFTVRNITGVALSFGVRGGLPTTVPPYGDVVLTVAVSLPACKDLPTGGRPRGPDYGDFTLELADAEGQAQTRVYTPSTGGPLHSALIALRQRICPPGTYRS